MKNVSTTAQEPERDGFASLSVGVSWSSSAYCHEMTEGIVLRLVRVSSSIVTQENNLCYPATAGWDYATGFGTPNLPTFFNTLSALAKQH